MSNDKNTEVEQDKPTTEEKVTPPAENLESLQEDSKEMKPTVGLDKFLDEKTKRKDAEAKAEALAREVETLKTSNKSAVEISSDLKALALEHNVDEGFLVKLVSTVQGQTKKQIEAEMLPKLQEFETETRKDKFEKKFEDLFSKTLTENPEYKEIVNKDVIKTLALNPMNAKKTLPQLLEEAYGNAVQGKKTLETGQAGREPEKIDFSKMTTEDYEKINSNPELKKAHSDHLFQNARKYL